MILLEARWSGDRGNVVHLEVTLRYVLETRLDGFEGSSLSCLMAMTMMSKSGNQIYKLTTFAIAQNLHLCRSISRYKKWILCFNKV